MLRHLLIAGMTVIVASIAVGPFVIMSLSALATGIGGQINWPGLLHSAMLSLWVGLSSTLISCLLVMIALAALDRHSRSLIWFRKLLAPFLAVPHAAVAVGLAFLMAPSGWINRWLASAGLLGATPPDYLFPQDPFGISLILGLALKETPFLFLVLVSQLPHAKPQLTLQTTQSLGYGRSAAFLLTVTPAAYKLIRLPVFAVLAYGIGGVDMALILGPNLPPVLSVQVFNWWSHTSFNSEDMVMVASLALLVTTVAGFAIWCLIERIAHLAVKIWASTGRRGVILDKPLRVATSLTLMITITLLSMSIGALVVWSIAGPWSWPEALPSVWNLRHWSMSLSEAGAATADTMMIAVISSLVAILISLLVLETAPERAIFAEKLIWLPLLLPQVILLPAIHYQLVRLGFDGNMKAVVAVHVLFVLPYVHLCLAGPFRSIDRRLIQTASAMGMSPLAVAFRIRLPMLLTSLILALAVGMAVSIAQYLPTLMIGGGRIRTITTETLALASGMNRRIVGVYATLQALLPCIVFAIAMVLPRLVWRERKLMRT